MEEAVWMVVGVISILLAIGVMTQFMSLQAEDDKAMELRSSVDELFQMCSSVCSMPEGTNLKATVTIPSNSLLRTSGNSICGEKGDELFCRNCDCELEDNIAINLTSERASDFFFSHNYDCFFLRKSDSIDMSCFG